MRDLDERIEAQGGEPFDIPRGAIVIDKEAGTFELPPIIEGYPGDAWDAMDWDDYYDDVGDEDADSYGEDAAK